MTTMRSAGHAVEWMLWCRDCSDVHRPNPPECSWSLEEVDPERIPLTCPGCGRYVDVIPCETGEWVIEEHTDGGCDAAA